MKKIFLFIFTAFTFYLSAQSIAGGSGNCMINGNPNSVLNLQTINQKFNCAVVIDTTTGDQWIYKVSLAQGSRWENRTQIVKDSINSINTRLGVLPTKPYVDSSVATKLTVNQKSQKSFGDSFTYGAQSNDGNGYAYRLSLLQGRNSYKSSTIGGEGIASNLIYAYKDNALYVPDTSFQTIMVGLNDLRRGGTDPKTLSKFTSGLNSFIANHFLRTFVSANSPQSAQSGSMVGAVNAELKSYYNAPYNSGIRLVGAGSSLTTSLTGSSIVVTVLNTKNSSYAGGVVEILIDGSVRATYDTGDKTDGYVENIYTASLCAHSIVITGLRNQPHTVVARKVGAFGEVYVDYFGVLKSVAESTPLIIGEICNMSNAGLLVVPANGTNALVQQYNDTIHNIVHAYRNLGYPVKIAPTNKYYNTLTDVGSDNIHPNDLGYSHLTEAFLSVIEGNGIIKGGSNLVASTANNRLGIIAFNDTIGLNLASLNVSTPLTTDRIPFYNSVTQTNSSSTVDAFNYWKKNTSNNLLHNNSQYIVIGDNVKAPILDAILTVNGHIEDPCTSCRWWLGSITDNIAFSGANPTQWGFNSNGRDVHFASGANYNMYFDIGGTQGVRLFSPNGGNNIRFGINSFTSDNIALDVKPTSGDFPLRVQNLPTGILTNQIVTTDDAGIFAKRTVSDVTNYSSYAAISSSTTYTSTSPNITKTTGTITVTLPTASNASNKSFTFVKSDISTVLTIQANGSETINNANFITSNSQWDRITLFSTGTEWLVIGQ